MSEVYSIGVSIVLANGVSAVLARISNEMLGLKSTIGDVESSLGRWASAIGGAAILATMAKITEAGSKLVHQQELMKIAGLDRVQIESNLQKAYEVSAAVQTTNVAENLKHLRELTMAFGTPEAAREHLADVSRSNAILNAVKGGGHDEVWELVKALEQKGETLNPTDFNKYLQIMTKVVEASGGKVSPQQFFAAFKYGRTATLGWDEDFIGNYLPRLIQSMTAGRNGSGGGSGGPGNALMTAFAEIVQGTMGKKAVAVWEQMGLIDPNAVTDIGGGKAAIGDNAVANRDLMIHNPYKYTQDVIMPALQAHGITSQEDIIATISKLLPVRTASQVITEMGLQGKFHEGWQSQFEKEARLNQQAMPLEPSYAELSAHDPTTIMAKFQAQWTSLMQALGSPMVDPAMQAMNSVTNALTTMTQFAADNPKVAKGIELTLGALAAGLAAVAVVSVASLAPIAAVIAGTLAAVAAFVTLDWQGIKNTFGQAFGWITDEFTKLPAQVATAMGAVKGFAGDLVTASVGALSGVPGIVGGAISGVADKLKQAILDIPGQVAGAISDAFGLISKKIIDALTNLLTLHLPSVSAPTTGPQQPTAPPRGPSALPPGGPTLDNGLQGFAPTAYFGPDIRQSPELIPASNNWMPSERVAQPVQVPVTLDLDGRTLAESISERLAELFLFPGSAPYAGGSREYASPDAGFYST